MNNDLQYFEVEQTRWKSSPRHYQKQIRLFLAKDEESVFQQIGTEFDKKDIHSTTIRKITSLEHPTGVLEILLVEGARVIETNEDISRYRIAYDSKIVRQLSEENQNAII